MADSIGNAGVPAVAEEVRVHDKLLLLRYLSDVF